MPCNGNCPPKKTGFIKLIETIPSLNKTQFSALGVELTSENLLKPCIVRVNRSTDQSGKLQSMFAQMIANQNTNMIPIFKLNLASEQSLGCTCFGFGGFREKQPMNVDPNEYNRLDTKLNNIESTQSFFSLLSIPFNTPIPSFSLVTSNSFNEFMYEGETRIVENIIVCGTHKNPIKPSFNGRDVDLTNGALMTFPIPVRDWQNHLAPVSSKTNLFDLEHEMHDSIGVLEQMEKTNTTIINHPFPNSLGSTSNLTEQNDGTAVGGAPTAPVLGVDETTNQILSNVVSSGPALASASASASVTVNNMEQLEPLLIEPVTSHNNNTTNENPAMATIVDPTIETADPLDVAMEENNAAMPVLAPAIVPAIATAGPLDVAMEENNAAMPVLAPAVVPVVALANETDNIITTPPNRKRKQPLTFSK